MQAIVAVYDDWGIGRDGTQPVTLNVDRQFFRKTTKGAAVVVGRKTAADFPGGRPLPGRLNILLTRGETAPEGFLRCESVEQAAALAGETGFVIGGGTVYRQMLPYCHRVYVTKLHITPESDTFFENLDENPDWTLEKVLETGEEAGIFYEICLYTRR